SPRTIEGHAEVELPVDVNCLFDEDLPDHTPRRTGLRRDQGRPQDRAGVLEGFVRIARDPDPAPLSAPPRVDLRLDDDGAAEFPRDVARLVGGVGDLAS